MEASSSPITLYTAKAINLVQLYKVPLLTVISLPFLRTFYLDYCDWYNLGAGGVPHNPFGWLVQSIFRIPASRDLRSTACYKACKTSDLERQSFMENELPRRSGWLPKTGKWCIPHRQLEDTASAATKKSVISSMTRLAGSNAKLLGTGPSHIEGGAPALHVKAEVFSPNHAHYPRAPHEFFHIHEAAEGSAHAILSAEDASLVIERGWAERHGLAGRALGFPMTYVMVFAARDEDEVKIVTMIAKAAARYALEGKTLN